MKKIIFATSQNEKTNLMKRLFYSLAVIFAISASSTAQTLEQGIMELENENYAAALSTFSKLNVNDPKNTIYHYYIGEVQYALENYEGAKSVYSQGLSVSNKCDACRVGLAKLDLENGRYLEAKKQIDRKSVV